MLFESRCCGKFKIVEYLNGNDVTVEFVETNYTTKTTSAAVRRGDIEAFIKKLKVLEDKNLFDFNYGEVFIIVTILRTWLNILMLSP